MKHSYKSEDICFQKVGTALAFYGDWEAIEKKVEYTYKVESQNFLDLVLAKPEV